MKTIYFSQKCDATCDAYHRYALFLWLRKNTFYCMMELPRKDGKRRYWRQSLHTRNFYEAREALKRMAIEIDKKIKEKIKSKQLVTPFMTQKELIETRDKLIEECNLQFRAEHPKELLSATNTNQQKQNSVNSNSDPIKEQTIAEVLESFLMASNNKPETNTRKKNRLNHLLTGIGLNISEPYSHFHNPDTITKLNNYILNKNKNKNNNKREYITLIKGIANFGYNLNPDLYKLNIIQLFTNIKKTKKSELRAHEAYSESELLEIFNPKHDFFKENPDVFWICLIGLYTGARANSAVTLQYKDIIKKDEIDCIYFREDTDAKKLKTQATERILPIHKQLIALGFVDYINRKKKKLKASDKDFIFQNAVTKSGKYNNKYTVRVIFPFFKQIGVKKENGDQKDFHSFRKNASFAMQKAGLIPTCINKIIGWDGIGTMERSYSNYKLDQINEELNKFNYDFLKPHFDEWKKIMAKINQVTDQTEHS